MWVIERGTLRNKSLFLKEVIYSFGSYLKTHKKVKSNSHCPISSYLFSLTGKQPVLRVQYLIRV